MSTGMPAGRCKTFLVSTTIVGIAEGPDPLPTLGLDPRRRVSRQRQEPLASDQCIGDERRQDGGRQNEAAEHDPARGRHPRAPARPPDHLHEEDHDQREEGGGAG